MAPRRPYWRGYLKLSLVTCPVAMSPATSESEKVRFHTLNKASGNRVVSRYVDAVTGRAVKDENEAKGYERGENDFVLLTDDELESVTLETVRTIDIETFVPRESIEWVYLETPHYLMPSDKIGNEAFAVIREAMKAEKVLGISRVVIGRRERAVVLEPRGEGIVVWTLRFGDEVRPEKEYFQDIETKSDPKTVMTIKRLIKPRLKKWSPSMVTDPIQESLLKLIASKKKALKPANKAKGKAKEDASDQPSNVINIMPTRQDLDPSPALSIVERGPKRFEGRKLGILVADGADAKLLKAVTAAVTKEKAVFEIIAPKVGGVTAADGSFIEAQHMIDGGPSVLFDAVVLLTSHQAIEDLVKEATARDFVADAFQHCKYIGYDQSALPLLDKAGIANALDEGTIALSSGKDVASFVEELGKLRVWGREPSVKLGKASAPIS